MKILTALAFAAALGVGGAARAQSIANPDPAAVRAGVYAVEPMHTRILFSVSHLGFTTWYGNFTGASGALTLDPGAPAASQVSVSVPTASISTTNAKLDDELKGGEWFDAARFPTITFKSERVIPTGSGQADVTGELTLHGVTRPVTLKARFNGAGMNPLSHAYTVGFEATGRIKRSEFGVTKYVPMVGNEVDLIISAAFERKAG
ncbi:MAG TPA: YceI family protein [Caulobacteraceae bacterium]|nr:YceI family protein [Caulobacteraceae bacterium]